MEFGLKAKTCVVLYCKEVHVTHLRIYMIFKVSIFYNSGEQQYLDIIKA